MTSASLINTRTYWFFTVRFVGIWTVEMKDNIGGVVAMAAWITGWKFEERDRVEREVERWWWGNEDGGARVHWVDFGEMWGRRGSRGEREWRGGGLITPNRVELPEPVFEMNRFFNSQHFSPFFLHFWPFFDIIQNLQNKIKSNKNLKTTIISSINEEERYSKNNTFLASTNTPTPKFCSSSSKTKLRNSKIYWGFFFKNYYVQTRKRYIHIRIN